MFIIPTLYLRQQRIANLAQEQPSPIPADPQAAGDFLRAAGVEMLHLIDIEAPSAAGHSPNEPVIRLLAQECGFHCQLSAKTRALETISHYFQTGIARIVLGTLAYQQPRFAEAVAAQFPGKVGVEITVRHGKVAIKGWTVAANKSAAEYLARFREQGISFVLYSDVNEVGTLTTDNVARIRTFAERAGVPVIQSTDLESLDQLRQLLHLEKFGVMGTILGRSLYENRFDLVSLITMTKEHELNIASDEATLIPE
ncbi:MAG: hypothetical protein HYV02_03905 [Deltaproteobacteria bacterium]|nr:hypothetical protein [Deltaproteobacteria bacterium]